MSEHEQTADILDGAADVIERDGWHQGDFAKRPVVDGVALAGQPVCALGALSVASGDGLEWSTRWDAWVGKFHHTQQAALGALQNTVGSPVGFWNDAPERTKQEVLDALRSAAKAERRLADGIVS